MGQRPPRARWGERAFWGLHSLTWDDLLQKDRHRERLAAVLRLIGEPAGRGRRVLDVGCGTGTYSVALARAGFDVTGLDFAPAMLRRAGAKAGALLGNGLRLERADFNRPLPFDDEAFELALCVCALHCVTDPPRFLAEIHRVVAPGGRFVVVALAGRPGSEGEAQRLRTTLPRRAFWWMKRRMARGPRWTRFSRPELVGLLAGAGFEVTGAEERGPALSVRRPPARS